MTAEREEPGVEAELARVAAFLEDRQLLMRCTRGRWAARANGLEALAGRSFFGFGETPTLAVADLGRLLRRTLGE